MHKSWQLILDKEMVMMVASPCPFPACLLAVVFLPQDCYSSPLPLTFPAHPLTGDPLPQFVPTAASQFVDIVQAEQICDPACDAEVLRHLAHSRPSWWSDAPHCITDV